MTKSVNPEVLIAQLETLETKIALKDKELNEKQDQVTKLFLKNTDLEAQVAELNVWKKRVIKDFKIPMG